MWCLATGQSIETYLSLTRVEREAFIEEINRRRS